MTEQYSQTVEITVPSKIKKLQWIGISAILFSLGLLMLAIFLKWYIVFAFIVLLAIGIVYLHFYNTSAKEYRYDFSQVRLVIAKKDLMGKTTMLLSLLLEDTVSLDVMEGTADDNDVIACNATYERGVYQLVYKEGDTNRRLLFAPDDYMLALLNEAMQDKCLVGQNKQWI